MDWVGLFEPTTSAKELSMAGYLYYLGKPEPHKENLTVQIPPAPVLFFCMLGSHVSSSNFNKKDIQGSNKNKTKNI